MLFEAPNKKSARNINTVTMSDLPDNFHKSAGFQISVAQRKAIMKREEDCCAEIVDRLWCLAEDGEDPVTEIKIPITTTLRRLLAQKSIDVLHITEERPRQLPMDFPLPCYIEQPDIYFARVSKAAVLEAHKSLCAQKMQK